MTISGPDFGASDYARGVLPPPSDDILASIARMMSEVRDPEERDSRDEELAESALNLVAGELAQLNFDEMRNPDTVNEANALLAAADEWASLASYISARVYAPASPPPKRLLKWARGVAERLRETCSFLEAPIRAAARVLNASGWTVAVNFPLGVSIGLDFDSGLIATQQARLSDQAAEVEKLRGQLAVTREELRVSQGDLRRARFRAKAHHLDIEHGDDPTT